MFVSISTFVRYTNECSLVYLPCIKHKYPLYTKMEHTVSIENEYPKKFKTYPLNIGRYYYSHNIRGRPSNIKE